LAVTVVLGGCSGGKTADASVAGGPGASAANPPGEAARAASNAQTQPTTEAAGSESPSAPRPSARTAGGAPAPAATSAAIEIATLAGGCFWCVESAFDGLPGVIDAVSGYTGGDELDPTYEQVSAGITGHYESVQVRFDPSKIGFAEILDTFWRQIDPADGGGQFADRGRQYRPAIFVHDEAQRRVAESSKKFLEESGWFDKPIATVILPASKFYPAEAYHQDYHINNTLHYKSYRWGSGRGPFVDRFWKDKPPIRVASEEKADMSMKPSREDQTPGSGNPKPGREYLKPGDAELRARLTPIQYKVTQQEGTEPPYDNEYFNNHEPGIYVDVVTGEPLFSSIDKFESGTGWPSFTRPLEPANVVEKSDRTLWMVRTEVRSKHGGSHLGHVFDDGPAPTGLRYCMNSASLRFIPADRLEAEGYGEYARLFGKEPANEGK